MAFTFDEFDNIQHNIPLKSSGINPGVGSLYASPNALSRDWATTELMVQSLLKNPRFVLDSWVIKHAGKGRPDIRGTINDSGKDIPIYFNPITQQWVVNNKQSNRDEYLSPEIQEELNNLFVHDIWEPSFDQKNSNVRNLGDGKYLIGRGSIITSWKGVDKDLIDNILSHVTGLGAGDLLLVDKKGLIGLSHVYQKNGEPITEGESSAGWTATSPVYNSLYLKTDLAKQEGIGRALYPLYQAGLNSEAKRYLKNKQDKEDLAYKSGGRLLPRKTYADKFLFVTSDGWFGFY